MISNITKSINKSTHGMQHSPICTKAAASNSLADIHLLIAVPTQRSIAPCLEAGEAFRTARSTVETESPVPPPSLTFADAPLRRVRPRTSTSAESHYHGASGVLRGTVSAVVYPELATDVVLLLQRSWCWVGACAEISPASLPDVTATVIPRVTLHKHSSAHVDYIKLQVCWLSSSCSRPLSRRREVMKDCNAIKL